MGLDISAYERVTRIEGLGENHDRPDNTIDLCNMEVFVARGDGIAEGIYRPSGVGFHFPAGSYSVYGNFRGGLAKLVGTTSAQAWKVNGGPFWEIINFADNEGFLGPKTSAKLAEDFDQHHDAAVKAWSSDPRELWRVRVYESFQRAFKTAAGTGVVYFG